MSQRHSITAVPPNNPAPAPDEATQRAVYVFGGFGAPHSAETLTAEGWKAVARWSPPTASNGQLGLVLQGKLYVVGGRRSDDDGQMLRAVECYDPRDNRWEAKASMPVDYEDLTGAVLHDRLYVVLSDRDMHNSLLVYDEKTNAWLTRCAPPTKRHQARLAALDGCLYLIGGHNHDWSLRKVEKYDPVRNEWRSAGRLRLGRDHSAQVFKDKLYVIGGTHFDPDTEMELEEVECYDPKVQKWRFVGDLKTPRSSASAFVLNNSLYVAGGTCDLGDNALASVERFDEASATWLLESKPMVEQRLEACCAVLALEPRRPAKRQRLE